MDDELLHVGSGGGSQDENEGESARTLESSGEAGGAGGRGTAGKYEPGDASEVLGRLDGLKSEFLQAFADGDRLIVVKFQGQQALLRECSGAVCRRRSMITRPSGPPSRASAGSWATSRLISPISAVGM